MIYLPSAHSNMADILNWVHSTRPWIYPNPKTHQLDPYLIMLNVKQGSI